MLGGSSDIADQCRTAVSHRKPTELALTIPGGVRAAVAIALFFIGELQRPARFRPPPVDS